MTTNWQNNFVLLETLRRDKDNRQNLLFTEPVHVITCRQKRKLRRCFQQMEDYLQKGFYLAGFLSYELGYFLEEALDHDCSVSDYPLIWLGVYNKPHTCINIPVGKSNGNYYLSSPVLATKFDRYKKNISRIKTLISRGETYQINYTSQYFFRFVGDVYAFYSRLKSEQQVSYSALVNNNGNYIISLSPELFFRIDKDRKITVKPMKGTAPVGTPSTWLQNDSKNTSENVMIVDLLRNDIGRICKSGTVRVQKLFDIEEYATLLQMTSTITGKLRVEVRIFEILQSLFPCGSVTGAPKIQSMKIIRALEKAPRNIYTGAIGYLHPNGQAVFNVAIRTIDMQCVEGKNFRASMGVGGGIVFDSRAEEEYDECRLKGKFLIKAMPEFALIETMLSDSGKILYLDGHLRRLKASARAFKIPCTVSVLRQELTKYVKSLSGKIRLRLLLKTNGEFILEHQSMAPKNSVSLAITLSEFKTQSDDPFLYHKTTHRKLYNDEYRKYAANGYFDVIFTNERGEITEGAISNIFIRKSGRYYTPPVKCGLLDGIGRRIALKKFKAKEKLLYLNDLKKADKIILTNSVRGINEVVLR